MKRYVWKFGLIGGAILAVMLLGSTPLYLSGSIDMETGELIGYAGMVVAMLMVYFGIRSYRADNGGEVSFGKAVKLGLLISLVASGVYVVVWEGIYYTVGEDFASNYQEHLIAEARDSGKSEAEIERLRLQMERFGELYANPFFNVAITFLEIFPVGLIVTLVSAFVLSRRGLSAEAAT